MKTKPTFLCLMTSVFFFGADTLAAEESRAGPQPNILLILADDLGYADLGAQGCREFQIPNIDRIYAGMVTSTDANVGRVLACLKKLKIDDNTMILFLSDNGAVADGTCLRI